MNDDIFSFLNNIDENNIDDIVEAYYRMNNLRKKVEEIENKFKDRIFQFLGESTHSSTMNYNIKIIHVSGKPDITITEDMIGQIIPGRKPGKRLHVEKK